MLVVVIGIFLMTLYLIKGISKEEALAELLQAEVTPLEDCVRIARRYGERSQNWRLADRVERHYRRARRTAPEHHCTYRGNLEAIRQGVHYEYDQIEG